MDDFLDFLKIVGVFILIMTLMLGVFCGIAAVVTKISCNATAAMNPDYQFKYNFWAASDTGCFVYYSGYWIPTNNVQLISGEVQVTP
jgi:hypothetical protein